MEEKEYFLKLTSVLKEELTSDSLKTHFEQFEKVCELARIIINHSELYGLEKRKCEHEMELEESKKIVGGFFGQLNPNYFNKFKRIMANKQRINGSNTKYYRTKYYRTKYIPIKQLNKKENESSVSLRGNIDIFYNETVEDAYTIVHEIYHTFNHLYGQESILRDFLGESTTITAELLFGDYLQSKQIINSETAKIEKRNRVISTYNDAWGVIFEKNLINIYKKHHRLDRKILEDYLESFDKDSIEYKVFSERGKHYLNSIMDSDYPCLTFPKRQRYVLGTLIAFDFYQRIKENPEKIKDLFYLTDVLGHAQATYKEDLSFLSSLDIPFIKDNNIIVNDEVITRLENSFSQELSSIKLEKIYLTKNKQVNLAF
ncbi:MAG: hypothetical protein WDA21_01410 [Bacilli bacterium]